MIQETKNQAHRSMTDSSETNMLSDVIVVDRNMRTPKGLTIPVTFENRKYVTKEGLIIPAVIVSEAEESVQDSGESVHEHSQSTDFTENEIVDVSVTDFDYHISVPRAVPLPRQNSLSLHEKLDAACNICSADKVSFSMLSFSTDDIGNADRFLAKYGDILRFNYDTGTFLLWNGCYWEAQNQLLIKKMCEEAMKSYHNAASYYKNSRNFEESEIYLHSCISCNNGKLNALVEILKERLAVPNELFDTYNYLLTVRNGTVDLRTGELFPHQKELFLTAYCDVDFSPTILSYDSVFATFISSICCGNIELLNFLQLCFGYALTGETKEQKSSFSMAQAQTESQH